MSINLKTILLSEDMPAHVKAAFGEIPFGELPRTAFLTKGNKKIEKNTPYEEELFYILDSWTEKSTDELANKLYSKYPVLRQARDYFPDVLKPSTPNGTVVYRGLIRTNFFTEHFMKTVTLDDFTDSTLHMGFKRYKYPIQYTPRRPVQSWSSDFSAASIFGQYFVLETEQDDDFMFSQELMNAIYGGDEHEILHFGQVYKNPIYLHVTSNAFSEIRKKFLSLRTIGPKTKQEVKELLYDFGVQNYTINPDLSVSVDGPVSLRNLGLKKIPIKFSEVEGDFDCSNNYLSSWDNFPDTIAGDLFLHNNKFTSLIGMPQKIGGTLMFFSNKLKSLQGMPASIKGGVFVDSNELESLEGAPKNCPKTFSCRLNRLTTLSGAPRKIGGDFYCEKNKLTSLKEGPTHVGGWYNGGDNMLSDEEKEWARKNIKVKTGIRL